MRAYLIAAFALSMAVNVLLLVSPLYMIQVYDRVLTSGSFSTLGSLSLIAVFLLGIYAFAEAGRRRALALAGTRRLDSEFRSLSRLLLSRQRYETGAPQTDIPNLQDVSRVQSACQNGSIIPLFDVPFTPLFLGLMYLLHPIIGIVGTAGAIVLVLLAIGTNKLTSGRHQIDQMAEREAQAFIGELTKSSNAIISMGLRERALSNWHALNNRSSESGLATASFAALLSGISKSFRQILQTAVLGIGAYLALNQQMSPGAIVAGSIIMGKGLAPVDQLVGGWKQIALTRASWRKISRFSKRASEEDLPAENLKVADLSGGLSCWKLGIGPPGHSQSMLEPFDFEARFGEVVLIVGPSGAGKSTLLQHLSAAWPALSGEIALGGRNIAEWDDVDRGRFVGYLPQKVELLPGTVAENICRFDASKLEAVEQVARSLGLHELFMSFPQAYSTQVGESGVPLSAGQKQAVGLARAVFGETKLLLLDEPTANLDSGLASRFLQSLDQFKQAGMLTIITTHDARLLQRADRLFSLNNKTLAEIDNPARGQPLRSVQTPTPQANA